MNVTCTARQLPRDRHSEAARKAVEINPQNLPLGADLDEVTGESGDRLAIEIKKWWGPNVDLTVGFMDSPPKDLQQRILDHMNAWGEKGAHIRFRFSTTDPMVRIARLTDTDMPGYGGYWSYIGTDVSLIPADQPTLNLEGFTMNTSESEFRRVVRHEAGHTLGFPHEHMRKELVERLDPAKVIAEYTRSQGWSEQEVKNQVLTPLEEASIFGTIHTDQTSIMCYQIDGSLTYDGQPIQGGVDINELDYTFAGHVYHGRPR